MPFPLCKAERLKNLKHAKATVDRIPVLTLLILLIQVSVLFSQPASLDYYRLGRVSKYTVPLRVGGWVGQSTQQQVNTVLELSAVRTKQMTSGLPCSRLHTVDQTLNEDTSRVETSGYATMVHGRGCNPHRCTKVSFRKRGNYVVTTSLMTS